MSAAATILVVDDDPSVLALVSGILARRQYRVISAASADVALALWAAEGGAVDLLLTDVVMPGGVSGHDLADRLCAEKPSLKIIFMTGHAKGPALAADVLRRSGRLLVLKPFTLEGLLQTVRNALAAAS